MTTQHPVLGTIHLPYINSMNVMLTPGTYTDVMFARGIEEILTGKEPGGTDVLINLRLSEEWLTRVEAVVARSIPDARSAVLRLAIKIGMFRLDHDIYWAKVRLQDEERQWKSGKVRRRNADLPLLRAGA